jgi:hypothetical protein
LSFTFSTASSTFLPAFLTGPSGLWWYASGPCVLRPSTTDAAFGNDGDLKALPYYGAFAGYTHHWLPAHSIVTKRSFIPAHRCSYTLAIGTVTPAVRYGLSSRVIGKV